MKRAKTALALFGAIVLVLAVGCVAGRLSAPAPVSACGANTAACGACGAYAVTTPKTIAQLEEEVK